MALTNVYLTKWRSQMCMWQNCAHKCVPDQIALTNVHLNKWRSQMCIWPGGAHKCACDKMALTNVYLIKWRSQMCIWSRRLIICIRQHSCECAWDEDEWEVEREVGKIIVENLPKVVFTSIYARNNLQLFKLKSLYKINHVAISRVCQKSFLYTYV